MIQRRIEALNQLGEWLESHPEEIELAMLKSKRDNAWFDLKNQQNAITSIAQHFLKADKLQDWISTYENVETERELKVGLITAGNIPAVGFHDLLCIYVSGHDAHVKLSEKDQHLLPAFIKKLAVFDKSVKDQIYFVNKLNEIDALIATGSDNSKRYFEYYFGHLPHIIRGNRNSLAIIDGNIGKEQLIDLGRDVFDFYGLGCRSVSQILIPNDFNENKMLDSWESFSYVMDNSKYENNFRYNYATSILNREEFKTNNFLILKENEELVSRIACLHILRYKDMNEAQSHIDSLSDNIQVCVSNMDPGSLHNIPVVPPGRSQQPSLNDYADRIDTLKFLKELK